MIWNGVFNKGPHEYHYDDRRPVTTEKKFNVLTQDESYAAQEQQRGRGSREDINGFPGRFERLLLFCLLFKRTG